MPKRKFSEILRVDFAYAFRNSIINHFLDMKECQFVSLCTRGLYNLINKKIGYFPKRHEIHTSYMLFSYYCDLSKRGFFSKTEIDLHVYHGQMEKKVLIFGALTAFKKNMRSLSITKYCDDDLDYFMYGTLSVREITLLDCKFTGNKLHFMSNCHQLRKLTIYWGKFCIKNLRFVPGLRELEFTYINGPDGKRMDFNDENVLKHICNLPKIRKLRFNDFKLNADSLLAIMSIPTLMVLEIPHTIIESKRAWEGLLASKLTSIEFAASDEEFGMDEDFRQFTKRDLFELGRIGKKVILHNMSEYNISPMDYFQYLDIYASNKLIEN